MALPLRNLTCKVGIPAALRRASVPHLSPAAGTTRPLTSGSPTTRGGQKNGAGVGGARKPVKGRRDTDPDFSAIRAQLEARREAVQKAITDGKRNERIAIGAGIAALAAAWVITEAGMI